METRGAERTSKDSKALQEGSTKKEREKKKEANSKGP
jgi:hypothetical protein